MLGSSIEVIRNMIKAKVVSREFKVLQAKCPLCGKVLEGISERHWMNGLGIHLHLAKNHMLPLDEVNQTIKTTKPSFETITKKRYYLK